MKVERFILSKRAFTLAEIMICLAIIGLISIFAIRLAHSHVDYGEKMGYWATVKNIQKGTKFLMSEGTKDSNGNNLSQLPSVASGTTGFCNRLADTYNTAGLLDCTATATTATNFKTAKPNFTLSNGVAFYNLGSNPVSSINSMKTSSFLGFYLPQNNIIENKKPIYVSALMEKQLAVDTEDGGGGGVVSSVTKTVSDSVSAVKDAAIESSVSSAMAVNAVNSSSSSSLACPSGQVQAHGGSNSVNYCLSFYDYDYQQTPTDFCKSKNLTSPTINELTSMVVSGPDISLLNNMGYIFTNTTCGTDQYGFTKYNVDKPNPGMSESFSVGASVRCDSKTTVNATPIPQVACYSSSTSGGGGDAKCPNNMMWTGTTCGCQTGWYPNMNATCVNCGINGHVGSDGINCACNTGYTLVNGTCVTACGANQVMNSSGKCVCKSGYDMYNGSCVAACSSSQERINGTCVALCGANQTRNSSGTCVCNSGYETYNGSCVAACSSSQERVNGTCVTKCGSNQNRNSSGTCVCNTGYEMSNGTCVSNCGSGMERVNGNCVDKCGANQSRNSSGTCVCNSGYETYNGSCVAACTSGQERVNGNCVTRCGANQTRNGSGTCVCSSGYEMISGSCVGTCASNQERVNGVCLAKCSSQQVRNGSGECVCNSSYDTYNGQCVTPCSSGKVHTGSDGTCQCPGGTEWVSGVNQCKAVCSAGQQRNPSSGDCVTAAQYYDIFVDVDGVSKGHSILNQDVFEFWVSMNGNVYPAPTSAMADNTKLVSAQVTYLNAQEKPVNIGQRYTYKQAVCMANSVDSSFLELGYCGNYSADSHCPSGNSNTCSVKLNMPGY